MMTSAKMHTRLAAATALLLMFLGSALGDESMHVSNPASSCHTVWSLCWV